MGDRIDNLADRVQAVEGRMDQVTATIDQRFDAVDAALVEQRQFTEFAFEKLERSVNAQFGEVSARFDRVDAEFAGIKGEFAGVKGEFADLTTEVRTISSGLGRLERKLDQFIDLHLPPAHRNTPERPS